MSKKRIPSEDDDPNNDGKMNDDGSESVFQQEDVDKRAKLTTPGDTTLQDLPMELIERILIKAVAMESTGMSRAKNVWKENAAPVIDRLRTVCSQWNSILSTNFFRNELNRTFDAQEKFHLEILHQSSANVNCCEMMTLKDELFILRKPHSLDGNYAVNVYDRSGMAGQVKDVIPLPGILPKDMAACSVSNCLYILNGRPHNLSVLRITKTDSRQFNISTVIGGMWMRNDTLSVAANGNICLTWQKKSEGKATISVHGPDGIFRHETCLSSDVYECIEKILPNSDGSFIAVSRGNLGKTKLTEFDVTGIIRRQYQSTLFGSVCQAGMDGRIVLAERIDRAELLDAEFNVLQEFRPNGPHVDGNQDAFCWKMNYDRERNEVVTVVVGLGFELTIFRFADK